MNSLKIISRATICIIMTFIITASELLYCAHSTLLSTNHFSAMLDNDKKLAQLTAIVYGSLSESASQDSSQGIRNLYTLQVLQSTDQSWVKGQIYINATALHKYLTSEAAALPTLDFVPLNTAIKESLVTEVMKHPQSKEKIEKVKNVLAVLDNKYLSSVIKFGLTNQLTSMLLELAPIRNTGFDKSTLQEIIRIYLSFSDKNTTIDEASKNIVSQMIQEALELDKLKDYFDTNLFLEKAFGSQNPIASLKTMINRADTSISLTLQVLFWCFILLLLINSGFSLKRLLKLTLFCTFIASAINFLFSALMVNSLVMQKLITQTINAQGAFSGFLAKLCVFLLRDYGLYLALQSVLLTILSLAAYLLIKFLFHQTQPAKKTKYRLPLWRLNVALIVFAISFSWWHVTAINREVVRFQKNIRELKDIDINQKIVKGLTEAGGMDFLKYLQKK